MRHAINFHLEEVTELDSSIKRPEDPRPLESLETAINPGFDEQGNILSDPFPPHRPRLTQLDRWEYEASARRKDSLIMLPHPNTRTPRHMTQEFISKLAGCSQDDARKLLDCFIPLEATEQMVKTYSLMARKKGTEAVVDHLWRFVIGAVEAETSHEEIEPWMLEPVAAGEPYPEWTPFGRAGLCEDVDLEPIEFERHEYEETDSEHEEPVRTWVAYEWDPTENLEWSPKEETESSSTSTVTYHVVEDTNKRQCLLQDLRNRLDPHEYNRIYDADLDILEALHLKHCGWMAQQGKRFCKVVKKIRQLKNLKDLGRFSQVLYTSNNFTHDQRSVLWTEYRQRRKTLERAVPKNITTLAIMKRIEAGVDLGNLGRLIWKAQKGEIRVRSLPSDDEFRLIWRAWKQKRLPQLTAPIKAELKTVKEELLKLAA